MRRGTSRVAGDVAFDRRDILIGAGLVVLALAYARAFFDFSRFPSEDAAMLMRYSVHLAQGHGFVWNIGEPPVDGATDFLFTVVLAALQKTGLTVEHAVHGVCYLAHLATVLLVYAGARKFMRAPRWAALLSAAHLAVGPGTLYTEAYFGTTFFAFFVCLTWYLALLVTEKDRSVVLSFCFALVALSTGLVRPEGVLLSSFVLVAIAYRMGLRRARTTILWFLVLFGIVGGAYFLWRWKYFGYPFPNPFYAKGGGHLHIASLEISVANVVTLALPFTLVLAYGMVATVLARMVRFDDARRSIVWVATGLLVLAMVGLFRTSNSDYHDQLLLGRYSVRYLKVLAVLFCAGTAGILAAPAMARVLQQSMAKVLLVARCPDGTTAYLDRVSRDMVFILIPVVGFTVSWVLIWDQMNYLMRFQYPILPVILMSWPALLMRRDGAELPVEPRRLAARIAAMGAVVFIVVTAGQAVRQHLRLAAAKHHRDGRHDVAVILREYGVNEFTMATTEAGLLPLYSEWRAVDLLGLNDKQIAHRGSVTDEYLDQYHPELIVIAAKFPIETTPRPGLGVRDELRRDAKRYADSRGFTLAAAYGVDASMVHCYYVRDDFAHAEEVINRIRTMTYSWYRDGRRSIDFAHR